MDLITKDAADFFDIPELENIVLQAIDVQASKEHPNDPVRASDVARDRKTAVLGAMINMHPYPEDCRAILHGYWRSFGGKS